jgi:hypothetical protein
MFQVLGKAAPDADPKKTVDINFSLDMFCRSSHVKKVAKSWYL